jgi:hypothetical protein
MSAAVYSLQVVLLAGPLALSALCRCVNLTVMLLLHPLLLLLLLLLQADEHHQ